MGIPRMAMVEFVGASDLDILFRSREMEYSCGLCRCGAIMTVKLNLNSAPL